MVPPSDVFISALRAALGDEAVRQDPATRAAYGVDALGQGRAPDLVVVPDTAAQIPAVARLCDRHRVPLVVRGTGTGYTGGAVPTHGGVVLSLERLNRILEIDATNLLAIVEPNVINGDLQRAVEGVGLFYPPDPASLDSSSIGGNVAECAGGPRAFKYGTTKRYVLALEAVLPSGEVVRTGSKAVKNVVGYDLTQLLVGSEGTLAIITRITLRLLPKPPARATISAAFATVADAVRAVSGLIGRRVVPAAIELVDGASLRAAAAYSGASLVPPGAHAQVIVECDGVEAAVREEILQSESACREAGALSVRHAVSDAGRDELWSVRRTLSLALRATGLQKINHDVVVPRGRIADLIDAVDALARTYRVQVASFGHAGDGNIHVNFMVNRADDAELARAREAERALFERVVALEGSISGEHGIGFAKAPYLPIELSAETIALMKRVKAAFDPNGILNPGKIFP
jgi:glycolate oxidase